MYWPNRTPTQLATPPAQPSGFMSSDLDEEYYITRAKEKFLNIFMAKYFPGILEENLRERMEHDATESDYDENLRNAVFRSIDKMVEVINEVYRQMPICASAIEVSPIVPIDHNNSCSPARPVSDLNDLEQPLDIDAFILFYKNYWKKEFTFDGTVAKASRDRYCAYEDHSRHQSLTALIEEYESSHPISRELPIEQVANKIIVKLLANLGNKDCREQNYAKDPENVHRFRPVGQVIKTHN